MIFNVLLALMGIVGFINGGWKLALAMMGFLFFFSLTLAFIRELYYMARYKDEYLACTDAVLANSATMADEVNSWSRHYYVHKSFYLLGLQGGIDCGYKLSIRDRPRRRDGGFGDFGFISFGV